MKKTTINNILMGIIVLLSVSICFLIFAIVTRPRYSTISATPEPAIITEASEDITATSDTVSNQQAAAQNDDIAADTVSSLRGKTSTRVNIRDYPSSDAKVLYTVEEGTTFDIIEVQSDGWTKISYEDETAYISSDYVIIINE